MSDTDSSSCTSRNLQDLYVWFLRPDVPPALATKAVAVFCKQFEFSDFNSEDILPSSLAQRRNFALASFLAFANVTDRGLTGTLVLDEVQPIFRRSWPNIWKWIQYFFFEFKSGLGSRWPLSASDTVRHITGVLWLVAGMKSFSSPLFGTTACLHSSREFG